MRIALEVGKTDLDATLERGKAAGIETRGVADHGFIDSIYFRDPNGYVVELTAKRPEHDEVVAGLRADARKSLDDWQAGKNG